MDDSPKLDSLERKVEALWHMVDQLADVLSTATAVRAARRTASPRPATPCRRGVTGSRRRAS